MFDLKYTLCRTCLEAIAQSTGFNIFITEDLAEKLISCTGQPVESNDEYPDQLCQSCYANIVMFYEFQQTCYKSLKTFLDLLKNESRYNISDSLKPDVQEQNQLLEAAIDEREVNVISRKSKNKLENQKIEQIAVTKWPNSRLGRKNYKSGVSKDKTKSDLTEYLQFDEGKVLENIDNHLVSREALKEQDEATIVLENVQVIQVLDKEVEIGQQQIEEIIFTESKECGPGTELTLIEKEEHQCHRCNLKFKTLFKLQVHLRQHDGLAPYLCSFKGCESAFDQWHSYKKHQNDHCSREQIFKCDMDNCERIYKNKSNLNIHKRKFHNFGPGLKTHMCEICGKVFKSSAVLNDHRFTHIDKTQLPFACEEENCSKRFSTKEKLKIHKMRHAGIKNFVCPYCGMRKTTRNELKIHINYHTLERTWTCRFCPKVCNSAGNLKMHIKNIHEGAKDFACRFCQRTFAKADTKKYHEMTHTGEKPNECKECGRRFVQPAALRTHRKIHLRQKEKMAEKQKCKAKSVKEAKSCIGENINETDLLAEAIVVEISNDAIES